MDLVPQLSLLSMMYDKLRFKSALAELLIVRRNDVSLPVHPLVIIIQIRPIAKRHCMQIPSSTDPNPVAS